jgi:hypothetical protein
MPSHTLEAESFILPIFVAKRSHPDEMISFEGTGFIVAARVLVTCWHCVEKALPPEYQYVALMRELRGTVFQRFKTLKLLNLMRDRNGTERRRPI